MSTYHYLSDRSETSQIRDTSTEVSSNVAATHEAAHAVIGRKLGLCCGSVTIVPERFVRAIKRPHGPGYTMVSDPVLAHADIGRRFYPKRPEATDQECDEAFCIALYAGAEAERVIYGKREGNDARDRELAARVLGPGARAIEPELRARANELVREHRGAIEWVAKALLQRRTLYPIQVNAVIEIAQEIEKGALDE